MFPHGVANSKYINLPVSLVVIGGFARDKNDKVPLAQKEILAQDVDMLNDEFEWLLLRRIPRIFLHSVLEPFHEFFAILESLDNIHKTLGAQ